MYNRFSVEYDIWASRYDPEGKELTALVRNVDFSNKRVLDIGCGTGRLSFSLAQHAGFVTGIDIDSQSIDLCNIKNERLSFDNCSFICSDFLDFSCQELYDVAVFSWSLYQIGDMECAIRHAQKMINKRGSLVILQPICGQQDSIFDIELKQTRSNYGESLEKQLRFCKMLFTNIHVEDIKTEFVYLSVDDAIATNRFFYELFNSGINDRALDEMKSQISAFTDDKGHVILSDTIKLIVCSNNDGFEGEKI